MESTSDMNLEPPLCANGCGFFASTANKNMCSKCYSDFLKDKIIKSAESFKGEKTVDRISPDVDFDLKMSIDSLSLSPLKFKSRSIDASAAAADALVKKKKKKNRCRSCNKKVGLIGFNCQCGDVFCGKHRYPEEHACKVDYKKIGRQLLVKQNPLCEAAKLDSQI